MKIFAKRLSFREYKRTIENLFHLSDSGRAVASRYLFQIQSAVDYYFNSSEADNPQRNNSLTDFSQLVVLVRQAQRYLSSF